MAVKRPRSAIHRKKKGQGTGASRVKKITSDEGWARAMRTSENAFVVVLITEANPTAASTIYSNVNAFRAFYAQTSSKPGLERLVFAEASADAITALQQVREGSTQLTFPTILVYHKGAVIEEYSGARVGYTLLGQLKDLAARAPSRGLWKIAVGIALGLGAVLAGVAVYVSRNPEAQQTLQAILPVAPVRPQSARKQASQDDDAGWDDFDVEAEDGWEE